ncbi:hypothetical protein DFH27DRAFT_617521 [Peziza echinospora]|nr:hypothetical protein DFH27DRAFT_617521 [Peziza echinospora]
MAKLYVHPRSQMVKRDGDRSDDWQFGGDLFNDDEGRRIRYGILLALVLFSVAFLIFAYQHANRRIKKGLPPMGYHRWLVSHRRTAQFEQDSSDPNNPNYNNNNNTQFTFYGAGAGAGGDAHALHAVPPPAYNPNYVQPPSYPGPPGASKVDPVQEYPVPPYMEGGNGGEGSSAGVGVGVGLGAPLPPTPVGRTQDGGLPPPLPLPQPVYVSNYPGPPVTQ